MRRTTRSESLLPTGIACLFLLLGLAIIFHVPVPAAISASAASAVAPVSVCSPDWNVVDSPSVGDGFNNLNGVAALSTNDVWAVGTYRTTTGQTLAEHWDGSAWSVVPSPNMGTNDNLSGVAVVSTDDVWAVGVYMTGTVTVTLAEHWDGSAWSIVPSPNGSTGSSSFNGVVALSTNDVWAVGSYGTSTLFQTLVEHWDGSTWSVVPSPNMGTSNNYLFAIAAVSADDVWAVGTYGTSTQLQTLTEHWDGSAWSIVPSPNGSTGSSSFNGVAALSTNDVWAVGSYGTIPLPQTLAEHWDGSAWSVVSSPNMGTDGNYLQGVAAISANDVWAVGQYAAFAALQTLVEHWNGSAWSIVPSPNASDFNNTLNGVAAISANDVWAAGGYNNDPMYRTLVERYNPCTTPTPTTTPTTTASPTACAIQFTDVRPGSTFYPYIRCLACRGIINGYPDGAFRPNANVTRGQLSKIISNSAGFDDTPSGQQFQDVPPSGPDSTFYVFIYRLVHRGYINGYQCGGAGEPCLPPDNLPYFRPNNNATRGQISKIDSNAAGFSDTPTGQQFQDGPVGSTYYTYTYRLVSRIIMSGYQCGGAREPCIPHANLAYFRPNNNATRGQTGKIVANTFFPDCQTPTER